MFSRLFRKKREELQPTPDAVIQQCKTNLLKGKDADTSARRLGDIAIEHSNQEALLALWEAICETGD